MMFFPDPNPILNYAREARRDLASLVRIVGDIGAMQMQALVVFIRILGRPLAASQRQCFQSRQSV